MNNDYTDDDDAQKPMTLEDFREDYDWRSAVSEAAQQPDPVPGFGGVTAWSMDDIAEVIASDEGENDGRDWVAVLRLNDGRLVFMSAGCDYTGWDCQASGRSWVSNSLPALLQLGASDGDRDRLKISLRAAA